MKTFRKWAAQGDVMLRRITKLPDSAKRVSAEKGLYVVAHSETGHNHVIEESPYVSMYESEDPFVGYLQVIEAAEETECLLEHLRSWDTHETITVSPGIFEVRRQREQTPEGWHRKAQN